MGYSNYCRRIAMTAEEWQIYINLIRAMFQAVNQDKSLELVLTKRDQEDLSFDSDHDGSDSDNDDSRNLGEPLANSDIVIFTEECGCEPFVMTPCDSGFWSCKTRQEPYDFAVKAALVLLAEVGGAVSITCDSNDIQEWSKVITWMRKQPGLPNSYPKAEYMILSNYKLENMDEDSELEYSNRQALKRKPSEPTDVDMDVDTDDDKQYKMTKVM